VHAKARSHGLSNCRLVKRGGGGGGRRGAQGAHRNPSASGIALPCTVVSGHPYKQRQARSLAQLLAPQHPDHTALHSVSAPWRRAPPPPPGGFLVRPGFPAGWSVWGAAGLLPWLPWAWWTCGGGGVCSLGRAGGTKRQRGVAAGPPVAASPPGSPGPRPRPAKLQPLFGQLPHCLATSVVAAGCSDQLDVERMHIRCHRGLPMAIETKQIPNVSLASPSPWASVSAAIFVRMSSQGASSV
jgi:hypothetical protein